MKTAYSFMILRYVHDIMTGEFINVGVVLYSPEARFLGAICNKRYGRLTKLFLEIESEQYRSLMRYIESHINAMGERLHNELPLEGIPQSNSEQSPAARRQRAAMVLGWQRRDNRTG